MNSVKFMQAAFALALIALAAPLVAAETSGQNKSQMGETNGVVFNDSHHGFRILIPDSWRLEEGFSDQHLDFVVIGMSPTEGPNDRFVENMNILVETLDKPTNNQEYFMWNLVGLMEELPEFQMHEKDDIEINGVAMSRIAYSWKMDTQRTFTYQFIFVKDQKGYVMTFSSEPEQFDSYRRTFDGIAASFAFQK